MAFTDKVKSILGIDEDYNLNEFEEQDEEETTEKFNKKNAKLVPLRKDRVRSDFSVHHVRSFECTEHIADDLSKGISCLCNLQRCDERLIRRVADFLTGAVSTIDGEVHQVGIGIFFVVPKGKSVSEYGEEEPINFESKTDERAASNLFKYDTNADDAGM